MAVVASSASSAGAAGARSPEEKALVAFADACEKAVIGCDDVATHGDDRTLAARKALVTRLQGLLKRADDARARHGDA